jgi:prefoldin subunit 5
MAAKLGNAPWKKVSTQADEIEEAQVELERNLKVIQGVEKPSEYSRDLVSFMKKYGIRYSDKDADHRKNVKMIEDSLKKLKQNRVSQEQKLADLTKDMKQTVDQLSRQLEEISKLQQGVLNNIK